MNDPLSSSAVAPLAIAAAVALGLYFYRDALGTWFAAQGHSEAAGRWFGLLLGSWFELTGTTL